MSIKDTITKTGRLGIMPDESELWDKFRNGDQDSLFELYKRLYVPLVNYAFRLCEDKERSKDAFSDLMLSFWDKREQLKQVKNVRSYLMTALKHKLFYDLNIQNKISQVSDVDAEEVLSYEDILINIQQQDELSKLLKIAFAKLTPRQAQFITMKYYDGLSYEEIAAATGVDITAVYNKVYEGIKTLRKHLPKKYSKIPTFLIIFLSVGVESML